MSDEEDSLPPPPKAPEFESFSVGTVEVKDLKEVKLRKVAESEKHYVSMAEMIDKIQGNYRKEVFGEKIGTFLNDRESSRKKAPLVKMEDIHWSVWHGKLGKKEWPIPKCVAKTEQVNRSDQGNLTNASEYLDSKNVLNKKMKIVADLIKKSKFTVAYTGAGISRAGGIADYGTKAENSIMNKVKKTRNPANAKPTYSHYCISNLERNGLIHKYVQQNHDGLPQKAGFPQEKMNEIHGAWFDPSNPVVSFRGNLRNDLFSDMVKIEKKTTLCLCLGTSLSGMNADRCVITPSARFRNGEKNVLGSVIVNLQFTPLDIPDYVSIRVFAKIDDAMKLLMKHLKIKVNLYKTPSEKSVIQCPYNEKGELDKKKKMILNMAIGQKVKIVQPGSKTFGKEGLVVSKNPQGNYMINFPLWGSMLFGCWWMNVIKEGRMKQIPLVNVNPQFK